MDDQYPPPGSPFTTPLELSIVQMVHERCEAWKHTVGVAIDYMGVVLELERAKERSYRRAAALLGPSQLPIASEPEETPDRPASSASGSPAKAPGIPHVINDWLVPLQALALRGNGESEALARYIERSLLPELHKLRDAVRVGGRALREQLGLVLAPLHRAHDGLRQSMQAHQAAWASLLAAEGHARDGSASAKRDVRSEGATDPWLLQVRLALRLQAFLVEKAGFAHGLQAVHDRQRTLDGAWAASLQTLLGDFVTIAARSTLQLGEQLQDVAHVLAETGSERAWAQALRALALDYSWRLDVPPFDGLYAAVTTQLQRSLGAAVADFAVVKCGFLRRQSGSGFGTKHWAPLFFVLADSGFLHGYGVARHTGLPTHAANHRELQELNATVPLYTQALVPEPFLESPALSIWLGGGTVAPVIGADGTSKRHSAKLDSSGCAFTVTSGPTGSGGFLFGGRGEKRHVLQSLAEEDMVDWIVAIKQVIAKVAEPIETGGGQPAESKPQRAEHEEHDQPLGHPDAGAVTGMDAAYDPHSPYSSHDSYSSHGAPSSHSSYPASETARLPPELERNPWEE